MPERRTPKQGRRALIAKALFVLLILALSVWAAVASGLWEFFRDEKLLQGFLDSLGPWAFAGFVFLQVLQVVAAPVPGEAAGFLGGYLFGPFSGFLLSTAGLTLGSVLAFTLARLFGRPLVLWVVGAKTLERFDYLTGSGRLRMIFLFFVIPGFPKDYFSYVLGLGGGLALWEFLVVSASGRLLGTALLSIGGAFARRGDYLMLSMVALLGLVVIAAMVFYGAKIEAFVREAHKRNINESTSEKDSGGD